MRMRTDAQLQLFIPQDVGHASRSPGLPITATPRSRASVTAPALQELQLHRGTNGLCQSPRVVTGRIGAAIAAIAVAIGAAAVPLGASCHSIGQHQWPLLRVQEQVRPLPPAEHVAGAILGRRRRGEGSKVGWGASVFAGGHGAHQVLNERATGISARHRPSQITQRLAVALLSERMPAARVATVHVMKQGVQPPVRRLEYPRILSGPKDLTGEEVRLRRGGARRCGKVERGVEHGRVLFECCSSAVRALRSGAGLGKRVSL